MSSILSGLGFRFGQRAACSRRFVTPCQSEVDDDVPLVVDKGTEAHGRLMDTSLSRPASTADIRQNMTGQQWGARKWKCLKNVNRHTGTFVWSLFLAFCRWSLVCRGVRSSSARRLNSCRESNMTSGHVVTVTLLSCNGYLKPKPASVSPSSCDSLSSFARTRSRAHAHRNSGSWTVGKVSDIFMDVKNAKVMSDIFFVLRAEGIGWLLGDRGWQSVRELFWRNQLKPLLGFL